MIHRGTGIQPKDRHHLSEDEASRIHGECGKCGSRDLLEVPMTPGDHSHIVLGENLLRTVPVTKYVCTDCGHVEEWVNSARDLARLKEGFRRG